jgi:hypothetical protein
MRRRLGIRRVSRARIRPGQVHRQLLWPKRGGLPAIELPGDKGLRSDGPCPDRASRHGLLDIVKLAAEVGMAVDYGDRWPRR